MQWGLFLQVHLVEPPETLNQDHCLMEDPQSHRPQAPAPVLTIQSQQLRLVPHMGQNDDDTPRRAIVEMRILSLGEGRQRPRRCGYANQGQARRCPQSLVQI